MKIGILAETTSTNDERVALTPFDARKLLEHFPQLQIVAQPSINRTFNNLDYQKQGIEISNDLTKCDLILGVKEVDIESVIPQKTYLFFAHIGKKQSYHQQYFQQLAHQKITLIDYEYFTDEKNNRITAFGHEAGIVGTYYALNAIGRRLNWSKLPGIDNFDDHSKIADKFLSTNISPIKIIISGTGLAAGGVTQTLDTFGIQRINKNKFQTEIFNEPVYCQLNPSEYFHSKKGAPYSSEDFHKNPSGYFSVFNQYAALADLYVACHYWEKGYPIYLTNNDLKYKSSRLKAIADISCDLNGPIASTIRESTHQYPFYDYNPITQKEENPFSSTSNISVMAVGNLPTALAREASVRFSKSLSERILPDFIKNNTSDIIQSATILKNGELTSHFSYLYNFLNEAHV